jgi:hypothetical protein
MACFLVTHRASAAFAPDDLVEMEKRVIGHLPRELKWVMTWYLPQQQLVVAHWDAPTEQAVRVALERSGLLAELPISKIESAVELYPKRYVARRNAAQLRAHRAHSSAHTPRELSGAYAESIGTLLQTRSALAHP